MGQGTAAGTAEPELSPEEAWPLVQDAILAFNAQVPDMAVARGALTKVLRARAWACYASPLGAVRRPRDFAEWVGAKIPQGLQTTMENLKEIAKGDLEFENALDEALSEQYPHGGDGGSKRNNSNLRTHPEGTTRAQALRRLRKDRKDLHDQVLSGKLSPNEAMIVAGFRHKVATVRADDPASAARTLRKVYRDADQRRLLASLLTEEE